ncbi:MAG TPA: asparagine synthetase B family protein [Gemmatimonadaceae bacterium]|nr:asparagine synthetase B family protein [Gemmatimonadaceae bacterium]
MSAILGMFKSGDRPLLTTDADACLHAMRVRGDRLQLVETGRALLGATHFEWETDLATRNPDRIARDGDVVVAADAALYYVDDLRRDLRTRGVDASGVTSAQLIGAAYRAWGDDCVHHLEGDFTFVLCDLSRNRMLSARDYTGRRSLYLAEFDGMVVVASSVAGILAHPACSAELDLTSLASMASFLFAQESDTPYRAIRSVAPGARVTCEVGRQPREEPYWTFPPFNERAAGGFDEAAEELRALLARAVQERLAPDGPTALLMSGGYDSTALFGAGKMRLREMGQEERLRAVCMSFPPGDPGREDEYITTITEEWNAPVQWLSIDDVPMLDSLEDYAARADEPFVHAFEAWFRALVGGARNIGARVALYGDGGDQLFAVSPVFMLDLFAQLRWTELAREWRGFGPQGYRAFFKNVVAPVARSAARFGRPNASEIVRDPPPWIREDFSQTHGLIERELEGELRLRPAGLSRASTETVHSLRHPMPTKVGAAYSAFALQSDVELRMPLLDERVVRFAVGRPRSDRASQGEFKRLLRHSMRGLIPPSVLAPRESKTGVLSGYFERSLRADRRGLVTEAFRDPVLAQLGIVDQRRLQEEWYGFCSKGGQSKGFRLFITLQVELWLRSRLLANGRQVAIPKLAARSPAN